MNYNYKREYLKMLEEQDFLIAECEKAGMTAKAIQEILDYDRCQLNRDQSFYRHVVLVDFTADKSDDNTEDPDDTQDLLLKAAATWDDPFQDSYDDMLQTMDNPKLYNAHQQFTDLQRMIWEMYIFDGLSEGEIAKELGVTQQTISRHLGRIRKKIKKFLK